MSEGRWAAKKAENVEFKMNETVYLGPFLRSVSGTQLTLQTGGSS